MARVGLAGGIHALPDLAHPSGPSPPHSGRRRSVVSADSGPGPNARGSGGGQRSLLEKVDEETGHVGPGTGEGVHRFPEDDYDVPEAELRMRDLFHCQLRQLHPEYDGQMYRQNVQNLALGMIGLLLTIIQAELLFQGAIDVATADVFRVVVSSLTALLVIKLYFYYMLLLRIEKTTWKLQAPPSLLRQWRVLAAFAVEVLIILPHPLPFLDMYVDPQTGRFANNYQQFLDSNVGLLMWLRAYMLLRVMRDRNTLYRLRKAVMRTKLLRGEGANEMIRFNWWLTIKDIFYRRPIACVTVPSIIMPFILAYGMYVAERFDRPLFHFGRALYATLITMLTVGYGDEVPVSAWGRFIAVLMGAIGLILSSFVVAVTASLLSVTPAEESAGNLAQLKEMIKLEKETACSLLQYTWRMRRARRKRQARRKAKGGGGAKGDANGRDVELAVVGPVHRTASEVSEENAEADFVEGLDPFLQRLRKIRQMRILLENDRYTTVDDVLSHVVGLGNKVDRCMDAMAAASVAGSREADLSRKLDVVMAAMDRLGVGDGSGTVAMAKRATDDAVAAVAAMRAPALAVRDKQPIMLTPPSPPSKDSSSKDSAGSNKSMKPPFNRGESTSSVDSRVLLERMESWSSALAHDLVVPSATDGDDLMYHHGFLPGWRIEGTPATTISRTLNFDDSEAVNQFFASTQFLSEAGWVRHTQRSRTVLVSSINLVDGLLSRRAFITAAEVNFFFLQA